MPKYKLYIINNNIHFIFCLTLWYIGSCGSDSHSNRFDLDIARLI